MTAFGSLLAVLAGLLHYLAQLAVSPSALTGATATTVMTALAATVLAGAVLAAGLALLTSVAGTGTAALPLIRRARALREKSWRAAFLRQRDPDAAGRARPRAPSAALAAAVTR
jgi:Family of unknown function (DUF6412)